MKLEGIKVIDLSLFLPGPHLSMMMADHGAEVIKVEPPAGEPVRQVGLSKDGETVWFRNTHRNKQSLCLNLKLPEARDVLLKLCAEADIFIEAFRPGAVERMGLDYDTLKAINPGLIYCSISAYGQTGSKRLLPAHDLSIQADSGTVSINEGADGQPAMPGMPVADMAGSLMALSGILMALYRRTQTGEGDYLDISMQDSLVAWLPNVMGPVFAEQRSPVVKHERSWGGAALYGIYRTADDQFLSLGGSEVKFAVNLLTALDRADLAELCKQPPGPVQDPVKDFLRQTFASQTLAYWTDWLQPVDVCWAPVRSLHEAIHEPHLVEREMLVVDERGNEHLGIPIKFLQEPGQLQFNLPQLGQHNREILMQLGYSDGHIDRLMAAKAVSETVS
ncbi:CoA transferase [Aestuariicella hydrocarbonica]|uniref:CoA transferase n=1 Tax=Pseudomaricurvus hydrocarbonicus TaxID=1470433 RepID=A0A9E5T3R8_9GAMM|nr:CaiB/BaiF CoA-transferase family protein [Aestuariicella hydrocarbonica]NHO67234.1 CoA transferase [Aestuariicella hydrocarbonica]